MPSLRPARIEDAPAVAALAEVLGYPQEVEACRERLRRGIESEERAVFVAEVGGGVCAWIEVARNESVIAAPSAILTALIVDPDVRRLGLGRGLVDAAAEWAGERGLTTLRVRSRLGRPEAHEFYRRLGFEAVKEQALYARPITRE